MTGKCKTSEDIVQTKTETRRLRKKHVKILKQIIDNYKTQTKLFQVPPTEEDIFLFIIN